jgi:hypothetical protein
MSTFRTIKPPFFAQQRRASIRDLVIVSVPHYQASFFAQQRSASIRDLIIVSVPHYQAPLLCATEKSINSRFNFLSTFRTIKPPFFAQQRKASIRDLIILSTFRTIKPPFFAQQRRGRGMSQKKGDLLQHPHNIPIHLLIPNPQNIQLQFQHNNISRPVIIFLHGMDKAVYFNDQFFF